MLTELIEKGLCGKDYSENKPNYALKCDRSLPKEMEYVCISPLNNDCPLLIIIEGKKYCQFK